MNSHCKKCNKIIKDRHPSALYCWDCVAKVHKEEAKKYRLEKLGKLKKYFGDNCIFCNSKREQYHHLNLDSKNNSKQNLIGLCSLCHKKVHYVILRPFLNQIIKSLVENKFNVNQIVFITGLSKQTVYKYTRKQKQDGNKN